MAIIIMIIVLLAPFQCIALLAASNLQGGLSSASSVVASTLRLWYGIITMFQVNLVGQLLPHRTV